MFEVANNYLQTYEIIKSLNTSKKNVDALTVYNGERGTIQVWVGTGEGVIYVFNAKVHLASLDLLR